VSAASDVLLALGVAAEVLCVVGVVTRRSVYDRLHYSAAATTVGPACIVVAIALKEGMNSSGIETLVAGLLLFLLNPVLTHATARAARLHERGTFGPRAEERRAS
jgi:monovalent cation/proton antiporter MnhG/PhaG subunit